MVGGMPPYRARKVMYYTDARFKSRVDLPTPDSERQRRGELLGSREPSDWERHPSPVSPFPARVVSTIASGPSPILSPGREGEKAPEVSPVVSQGRPADEPASLGVGEFAAFFGPDAAQVRAASSAAAEAQPEDAIVTEDDIPL